MGYLAREFLIAFCVFYFLAIIGILLIGNTELAVLILAVFLILLFPIFFKYAKRKKVSQVPRLSFTAENTLPSIVHP